MHDLNFIALTCVFVEENVKVLQSFSMFAVRETDLIFLQVTWKEQNIKTVVEKLAIRFWKKKGIFKKIVFGIRFKIS